MDFPNTLPTEDPELRLGLTANAKLLQSFRMSDRS